MATKLIALCACPMGLAHTFMAAEDIENEEKKRETQGSDGIKNQLTDSDIKNADIIIHCIAITPEGMDRFNGYDVYEVPLQEMIKNATGVFNEIEEDMKS
jgi:hypothetical protein